jgi:hypothetical protein
MRSVKCSLAGLILAGILAMMPAAAFARGGGGQGGRGGEHAFVGGGHASGGFTDRGFSPGFSGTRGYPTGRFGNRDHRVFFQQFSSPVYWSPYYPDNYSYLDNGPDNDYQSGDNSAASVQPESFGPALDHGPVVVSINAGNSRPMDSNPDTAYTNSGYNSSATAGKQRIVTEDANEKIGPRADLRTFVPPAIPQATQTAAKGAQTRPQTHVGAFGNLVLVSWLEDAGKDVIYVQNIETNDVQKITSEPNLDNFRLVKLRPNADPKLFEAVISNGVQEGPVRFRF